MRTRVFRAVLFLAVLGACAMPAASADKNTAADSKGPAAEAACPADDRVALAGLRAFIDPQTGQLRPPTPEEAASLARAAREEFSSAVESLQPIVLPDGTVAVDLKGIFMQDLIVTRNPDGSLSMRCVPDSEKAVVLATTPPRAPKPAFEER